ncbi:MAG: multiprotein bridging factor aMBF1 [Acidilobaceae archaeon]|nr:multiprotein bridging factor aMBF1 [Acidilobaceae archaeon]
MRGKQPLYCDICGSPAESLRKVRIEDMEVSACPRCASKLGSRALVAETTKAQKEEKHVQKPKPRSKMESFDIVEGYAEKIRKAREERGWSEAVLAQRLRVSADLIRKIESGKYKLTVGLAKSLEEVLKIKLLVPTEDIEEEYGKGPGKITLGDVVNIRKGEE